MEKAATSIGGGWNS